MQVHRLIEIIYILLEKGKVTAEELAKKFEVSTRTIYRDIENLSIANIPVVMEKGYNGGISLIEGYTLNKTILTDNEKMEIMSALSAVGAVDKESNMAISKLSSIFGGNHFDWIEVDFSGWYNKASIENKFEQTKQAILQKSIVCFDYVSTNGNNSNRRVAPLKLCFKSHAWYLYAYCLQKNDYRFFKLSRLNNLTVLDDKHDFCTPQKVLTPKDYFYEKIITVRLKIDKTLGSRVYDEFCNITVDGVGDYIIEMKYPQGRFLFNYIFSFGEHCEILEPIELRAEYKYYLEKIYSNIN